MLALGPLAFLNPLALSALIALPALWWLLRITPPRPRRIIFPPLRLLYGLKESQETPHKTPWQLLLLRLLLAALVIIAFARPVLHPEDRAVSGKGLLVLVIDNGWSTSVDWKARHDLARRLLDQAGNDGRPVILAPSAEDRPPPLTPQRASDAITRLAAIKPRPWPEQRMKLADALKPHLAGVKNVEIRWLAGRIDNDQATLFAGQLIKAGKLTIHKSGTGIDLWAVTPPVFDGGALKSSILHVGEKSRPRSGTVRAYAGDGRYLSDTPFLLTSGAVKSEVKLLFPPQLRQQIARLEIIGGGSAGSVTLIDERARRKTIGLLKSAGQSARPLLAPFYYIERALKTVAETKKASSVSKLIAEGASILMLADTGKLSSRDVREVEAWVKKGGTLIRFAGPRLAAGADKLTPVRLRHGGRSMGGALSWDTPQHLGSFEKSGPFAGLKLAKDVTVSRQVLAQPSLDLAQKTWGRLEDGTPLVTGSQLGRGWLILFHTTANAAWTDLPLSGLFVQMLERLMALAPGLQGKGKTANASATAILAPHQTLDGFGHLSDPPATAEPLSLAQLEADRPGPRHPPGFYGAVPGGHAFNLLDQNAKLKPLPNISGAAEAGFGQDRTQDISHWLLLAAAILFLLDWALLIGMQAPLKFAMALALMSFAASPADADDEFAIEATSKTRLAYIRTGDADIDRISRLGLDSLSRILTRRTAFEPGPPMSVDIGRDELVFFPFLYWPLTGNELAPSDKTLTKISRYMKAGGIIMFDTRDQQSVLPIAGSSATPQNAALKRILSGLDIPPLAPVPADHVLTKSFYLLQEFPGRWQGGTLWVEAGEKNDAESVTGILIGANDYAAAWAKDANGWTLPVVPGGQRQREHAIRTGVNIILYALTGNYKADQVHIPAILKRLGADEYRN